MVRLTGGGDDNREPTYTWAVLIIATCIVLLVLGALLTVAAFRMVDSITLD